MPRPEKYWYDQGYQVGSFYDGDPEDAPDPLSGEFAGESMPEIFGSWEEATEENQDAYETGYWAAIMGNPGTVPLHENLAALSQWTDYEAAVVEQAADELPPGDLKDAAHEQADAMTEAADALDDAAEQAAETAAEVFVDTGVPSDEQTADVVAGNPSEEIDYSQVRRFETAEDAVAYIEGLGRSAYIGEYGRLPGNGGKGGYYVTTGNMADGLVMGNPGDHPLEEISESVEETVTDVIPDPVEETIAESAGGDVAPEPDNWLFRKRFGRK